MSLKNYYDGWEEIDKMPELKDGEIFVSHVGDGEYSFNVFGSAHTELDTFKKKIEEYYTRAWKTSGEIILGQRVEGKERYNMYGMFFKYTDWRSGTKILYDQMAFFTIEQINPETFPIRGD